MTKLITFTDERMTESAFNLIASWQCLGNTDYSLWRESDLPEWLYYHHPYMRAGSKGFGWYAWKPFIVAEEVCKAKDGDIIVYADAGQTFVRDPCLVLNACPQDVILFDNGWLHIDWCKRDVLEDMLPMGYDLMHTQTQASLIFIRVSEQSRKFVKEWLAWSLMPGMIDNEPSIEPNYPTFREHRWDQAILGCLAIKYNIPLEWFPTVTNMHRYGAGIKYPAIVEHHRKRNKGAGNGDSEWS